VSLERALQQYSQNVTEKPFDIKTVPTIVITQTETHKSNDQVLPSSKAVNNWTKMLKNLKRKMVLYHIVTW
jgi:hypothetical protein